MDWIALNAPAYFSIGAALAALICVVVLYVKTN